MLSLCRSLMKPHRLKAIVAASQQRNLLLTSKVCERHDMARWSQSNQRKKDLLYRKINGTESIEQLQILITSDLDAMKPCDLVSCLIRFKNLVRRESGHIDVEDIPLFQVLSAKILTDCSSLDMEEIIQILRVAGALKLDCSDPLVQRACQALAPMIQEIHACHADVLLRALTLELKGTSDLTESLKQSLPSLFESGVEKWDLSDSLSCLSALEFVVRCSDLKSATRDIVIDAVRKILPQESPSMAGTVIQLFRFRGRYHVGPGHHKMHALLKECFVIVSRNISLFESNEIWRMMTVYSLMDIFEREFHDALWSVAKSFPHKQVMHLVDLSRSKDAFSSKDADALRALLQTREQKNKTNAQDTAESRTPDRSARDHGLPFPILRCKSREELRKVMARDSFLIRNPNVLMDCVTHYENLTAAPDDDPYYEKLAKSLTSSLSSMTAIESSVVLRLAEKHNGRSSRAVMRIVLQIWTPRIKKLHLNQIIDLATGVRGVRSWIQQLNSRRLSSHLPTFRPHFQVKRTSDLADHFVLALWTAFESQVKQQLDPNDEDQCMRALLTALGLESSAETQDFVIDAAEKFITSASKDQFAKIVWKAGFRRSNIEATNSLTPRMRSLIETSLARVAEDLPKFDAKAIRRTLAAYDYMRVFSRELNDAIWAMIPSLTFEDAFLWISQLAENKLTSKDAELVEDFLLVNKEKMGDINRPVSCARTMAFLALRSPGVPGEFGEIGLRLATMLVRNDASDIAWDSFLQFIRDLALLGVFPEEELDSLFSENRQIALLRGPARHLHQFLGLERLLRLQLGESCRYTVLPELKERASSLQHRPRLAEDLVNSVRNGLGGDQFVLEHVRTPSGVGADLIVAMSPDGTPVALAGTQSPLEYLPDDCMVMAILQCEKIDLFDDLRTKRVPIALQEHFLRAENIRPVTINMAEWESVLSEKRLPFVMRSIEEAKREGLMYKRQRVEKSL